MGGTFSFTARITARQRTLCCLYHVLDSRIFSAGSTEVQREESEFAFEHSQIIHPNRGSKQRKTTESNYIYVFSCFLTRLLLFVFFHDFLSFSLDFCKGMISKNTLYFDHCATIGGKSWFQSEVIGISRH